MKRALKFIAILTPILLCIGVAVTYFVFEWDYRALLRIKPKIPEAYALSSIYIPLEEGSLEMLVPASRNLEGTNEINTWVYEDLKYFTTKVDPNGSVYDESYDVYYDDHQIYKQFGDTYVVAQSTDWNLLAAALSSFRTSSPVEQSTRKPKKLRTEKVPKYDLPSSAVELEDVVVPADYEESENPEVHAVSAYDTTGYFNYQLLYQRYNETINRAIQMLRPYGLKGWYNDGSHFFAWSGDRYVAVKKVDLSSSALYMSRSDIDQQYLLYNLFKE